MKKIIVLAFLSLIFLNLSAQLKVSGSFRFRGNVNNIASFPNYDIESYPWTSIVDGDISNTSVWNFNSDTTSYAFYPGELDSLASEKNLATEKFYDLRFRPKFEYQAGENLKAVWVAEIGDLRFGDSSKGADQGADGVNIETKSLYFDWTFYKGHTLRTGIQNYMDPMVMIVEDDFAGVTLTSNWRVLNMPELNTKFGWLKGKEDGNGRDIGEGILSQIDEMTFDYGYSNYIFDLNYTVNRNNTFGLNVLYQNYLEDVSPYNASNPLFTFHFFKKKVNGYNLVNYEKNSFWIAPYVKMRPLYELSVEAEFVYSQRKGDFEIIRGELADTLNVAGVELYSNEIDLLRHPLYTEDESGYAFMLKTKYKATEDLEFGFNFLYASGEELSTEKDSLVYYKTGYGQGMKYSNELTKRPENFYKGASDFSIFSSKSRTGLEIMGTNGICDARGFNPTMFGDYFGSILPVLSTKYQVTKDHSISIAFGSAFLATEVDYQTLKQVEIKDPETGAVTGLDGKEEIKSSNFLGSEFDVSAKLNFGKLCIEPVAAFFFPGDLMQVGSKSASSNAAFTETEKMQTIYEIGLRAQFRF